MGCNKMRVTHSERVGALSHDPGELCLAAGVVSGEALRNVVKALHEHHFEELLPCIEASFCDPEIAGLHLAIRLADWDLLFEVSCFRDDEGRQEFLGARNGPLLVNVLGEDDQSLIDPDRHRAFGG